ncbi:transglycosylase domain-containing protein [Serratia ureilytica]
MRGFGAAMSPAAKCRGGSTISMQLAHALASQHLHAGGKLLQVLRAVQLELSATKRDIWKPT